MGLGVWEFGRRWEGDCEMGLIRLVWRVSFGVELAWTDYMEEIP